VHPGEHGDHADRHIDEKNPVPGILIGDVAADHGADDRRDDDGHRGEREGLPALLRRKSVENDRLLAGLQAASEKPLDRPIDQDLRERGRGATAQRRQREHADTDQEIVFSPDPARQ